jgi:hypothetical protein
MRNRLYALIACSLLVIGLFGVAGPAAAQNAVFVDAQGEVGIGTNTPTVPLHVVATAAPSNTLIQFENGGPARFRFRNSVNSETWNVGHQSPSGTGLVFSDVGDGDSELLLDVNGNLTITGTLTAGNPSDTFPDYVFAPDYELMPLHELSAFVRENRHLPNIPSAEDVAAAGQINVSQFQLQLLEKIEELTLYAVQQQKNIDELSAKVAALQQQATTTVTPNSAQ